MSTCSAAGVSGTAGGAHAEAMSGWVERSSTCSIRVRLRVGGRVRARVRVGVRVRVRVRVGVARQHLLDQG